MIIFSSKLSNKLEIKSSTKQIDHVGLDPTKSGEFEIINKMSSKCLGLKGYSTQIGNKIALVRCHSGAFSHWTISKIQDNIFIIKNSLSGQVIQINSKGKSMQNLNRKSPNQLFKFNKIEDGTWLIENLKTKECLDLKGKKSTIGNTITQTKCDKNDESQKWKFSYPKYLNMKIPQDGIYELVSPKSKFCIDTFRGRTKRGAQLVLAPCMTRTTTKWRLESRIDGSKKIINVISGFSINIDGGSVKNGARISIKKFKMYRNQVFRLEGSKTRGLVNISNLNSMKCLQVSSFKKNAKIFQHDCKDTPNQQFQFKEYKHLNSNIPKDGDYFIINEKTQLCIGTQRQSGDIKTKLKATKCNKHRSQQFRVKTAEDGNKYLIHLHKGYVLGMAGLYKLPGARAELQNPKKLIRQKFKLEDMDNDNDLNIRSAGSQRCLSINVDLKDLVGKNYSKADGQTIVQLDCEDKWNQEWIFSKISNSYSKSLPEPGDYEIVNYKSKLCISLLKNKQNKTLIDLGECGKNSITYWRIVTIAGPVKKIINISSGKKAITIENNSLKVNARAILNWYDGKNNQRFIFEKTPIKGNYDIKNVGSNYCLTINKNRFKTGTRLVQTTCTSQSNEQFFLRKVNLKSFKVMKGDFRIINKKSNLCVGIIKNSTKQKEKLVLVKCGLSESSDWITKIQDDHTFKIINKSSSFVAEVNKESKSDGAAITQNEWTAKDSQMFKIRDSNGIFNNLIINKGSRKCWTLKNGNFKIGAEIIQSTCKGLETQQFQFLATNRGQSNFERMGKPAYLVRHKKSGLCIGPKTRPVMGRIFVYRIYWGLKTSFQLTKCNQNDLFQVFQFSYGNNLEVKMIHGITLKLLQAPKGLKKDNVAPNIAKEIFGGNQRWIFTRDQDKLGHVYIRNLFTNKCLTTKDQKTKLNTPIVQANCKYNSAFKWDIRIVHFGNPGASD